jgi:hypothetical protein
VKTGAVVRPAKLIVHSLRHIFWHRLFTNVPSAIRRSWNALVGAKEKTAGGKKALVHNAIGLVWKRPGKV